MGVQQPKIGGEVRPHQDSTFLRTDPPSVVGLWWALEDSTKQNGCLWALPGAHAQGVARHFIRRYAIITMTAMCVLPCRQWTCLDVTDTRQQDVQDVGISTSCSLVICGSNSLRKVKLCLGRESCEVSPDCSSALHHMLSEVACELNM